MILTVKVTQEHIKRGEASNCNKCPIALAIAEFIINSPTKIWAQFIMIYDCKAIIKIPLPAEAKLFISNFDNLNKVRPFEFQIEIDEKFIKKS